MNTNTIQPSEGAKIIMNTIKDELFPVIEKMKILVNEIQRCRISYQLWSHQLNKLEKRYSDVATSFFEVETKLKTPDILFKGVPDNAQNMRDYFQFHEAMNKTLSEAIIYVEIIDRTLDRKNQSIQNNRTFVFAITAILVSVLYGNSSSN